MGATFTVSGHRPFVFGRYEAKPGDIIHEGWLEAHGLLGSVERFVRHGLLSPASKTSAKDSPAEPPESMLRVVNGAPTHAAPVEGVGDVPDGGDASTAQAEPIAGDTSAAGTLEQTQADDPATHTTAEGEAPATTE